MSFTVIPAIDIKGKKCVRLVRGEPEYETVFSDDPVKVAKYWEGEGAKLLHVVDLDGAFSGEPKNFDVIENIVSSISIPVQIGGGIRSTKTAARYLKSGASRIITGTKAFLDKEFIQELLDMFGERVVVGLDVKDGFVVHSGWRGSTPIDYESALDGLEKAGVKRIIYTNTSRDGTLEGIDCEEIEKLVKSTTTKVIASGGIKDLGELISLSRLEKYGLEGVIVGMALYTGKFTLKEALEFLKKGNC
ncbi:MAG: 1-(5-phosphoribosyl)-5-[(5-phosphoribosylamino)methylideneamino]imidazole-4-carboxamide isomerase [Actinomycetota bacterium]|nr:1-(5-phosphoribosyl)-5-[(5-phosphoribosylamino)methylideneamino]imidazole-4-carboxamide isomerase [Actinomycetota bacterium]